MEDVAPLIAKATTSAVASATHIEPLTPVPGAATGIESFVARSQTPSTTKLKSPADSSWESRSGGQLREINRATIPPSHNGTSCRMALVGTTAHSRLRRTSHAAAKRPPTSVATQSAPVENGARRCDVTLATWHQTTCIPRIRGDKSYRARRLSRRSRQSPVKHQGLA